MRTTTSSASYHCLVSQQQMHFAKKGEKDKKDEKKQKEKEQVHAEFDGKELDDLKKEYRQLLDDGLDEVDEGLKQIRSGRPQPNMFDSVQVIAYGEKVPFSDLCQVIVKGANLLQVKIFDDAVKDDVIKALQRAGEEFDMNATVEGKDLKVKLGTTKKEQVDKAIAQVKVVSDRFKLETVKEIRHKMQDVTKKLEKIMPKDDCNLMKKDFDKLIADTEAAVKKLVDAKEKEIKG